MEYRKFKKNGKEISLLGFGAMRFPTLQNGEIDEKKAEEMIDIAYKNGVNYFDTAYMYHNGKSQDFLGRVMQKYDRNSFNITNKMPIWMCKDKSDVDKIFCDQLKRCKVDYFDFYLVHSLDMEKWNKCLEWNVYEYLDQKRKDGFIKNLGFSFHDNAPVIETIASARQWDFAQIQLNYLDWDYQNAKLQYEILEKYNIPCIIMEPVRGGALANLPKEAEKLMKDYNSENSIASWAIRYCASLPNVFTVLSGMSDENQVNDNLKTMSDFKKLSSEEYEIIEKALKIYKETTLVPCTNCKYCIDCPAKVNIPKVFRYFNEYKLTNMKGLLIDNLDILAERGSKSCVNCGICLEKCPQKIQIPTLMKEITQTADALR